MRYKIRELDGPLLDAAVALAEGYELDCDGYNLSVRESGGAPSAWHPSTDWAQGGPIIERERIGVTWPEQSPALGYEWHANIAREDASFNCDGPTPLIAAMRAYCASKFGEEIDLP
jgi:hypothetical protein